MSTSDEQIWLAGRHSLANQGDPQAQMDLARAYWHGKIVPKDVKKSEALLRRAEKEIGEGVARNCPHPFLGKRSANS